MGVTLLTDYLTTREAAASLRVSYQTLMGWVYHGKLAAMRHGRNWNIHKNDVERLRVERSERAA